MSILKSEQWQYIVLGEVLEHINNPVEFLTQLNSNFKGHVDSIIITVPNAFALKNIKNAFRNVEEINSDHRYYFTPYTLGKILTLSGYRNMEFSFAETMPIISSFKHGRYMIHDFLHKIRIKRSPALCNHLIMTADL